MVDGADNAGPVDRLQNLLLEMTGRIDDDAVNSARELLGVGQPGAAAELLVGCLVAGGVPVTPTQQYHLRWILDQSRSRGSLVDRLQVLEGLPLEPHRFAEAELSDGEISEALRPVARRLTGLRALWCVARTTPAGVTYGAVPQSVLIAEVVADSAVPAAGYQILEALRAAGITCAVDVFSSGAELPDYHRQALAVARKVDVGGAATAPSANHARAPRRSSGGEPAGASVSDIVGDPPAGVPPAPSPAPEPAATNPVADELPARHADPGPVSTEERARAEMPASAEAPARSDIAAPADIPAPPGDPVPPRATAPPEPAAENVRPPETAAPAEPAPVADEALQEQADPAGANNPRVPAAVDAKLTDRERNLLQKLHEELAHREQGRSGERDGGSEATQQVPLPPRESGRHDGAHQAGAQREGARPDTTSGEPTTANREDPRLATMPGTAGFPPIGASGSNPGPSQP